MIEFLKKFTLPLALKKSIKKNQIRRYNVKYADAKKILLFFSSEGNQKIALVKSLQNKLKKDGKVVKCFYVLIRDEDKPDVHMDAGMERLDIHEFSLFGEIRNPVVEDILNEDYDYLIHADMESNIYCDLIISRCKARCRIGRYLEAHVEQYDLMVKVPPERKAFYLLDQIYHYIKII